MKIKFHNLGCIKETELDLRPLTVIIGPNNSGKTYIAYSVYGLWQRARQASDILDDLEFTTKKEQEDTWLITFDKNTLIDCLIEDIRHSAVTFQGSDVETFFQDSSRKIFSKTSFEIIISEEELEEVMNNMVAEDVPPLNFPDLKFFIKLMFQENNLVFEIKKPAQEDSINSAREYLKLSEQEWLKFILIFTSNFLKDFMFSEPLPFPAERNAFISNYKMLANRRYKLLKERERQLFSSPSEKRQLELLKEQGDIRYPQPVEDFLDFLANLEFQEKTTIDPKNKNQFQKLADEIENSIQNKNKTKLKSTAFGGKEIKVSVKRGLDIDLYNASSSIKQLAPFLLYLRFYAEERDFLVIDEPEMNLHPESQVKFLEALSILVNLGVRVLLTTHSPYIMAHLNNLVNGNHEDPERLENQASSLYLEDSRAFLPPKKVSAYEMKENQLVSLNDPDYGIRWDTLSDVSVEIQQKFFEIYEAGQKQQNEKQEESC